MNHNNQYYDQVRLLVQALPIVMEDQDVALKGGTAINLFVRNMPRLSVDIDLTFLPVLEREISLNLINNKMNSIATNLKKKISEAQVKIVNTSDQICRCIQLSDGKNAIKIEINHILRGNVNPCKRLSLCKNAQEDFKAFVNVQCLHFNDIYAGKICAALSRQHPRDLFDIKLLLDHEGISNELKKTFIVYLISGNRPLSDMLNPSFKNVRKEFDIEFSGMNFIPVEYEELEEARKKLIDQLKTALSEEEKRFLISFKIGEPEWSLLGIPDIEKLPAIKWKLNNIRKMKKIQHEIAVAKLKEILI